MLKARNAVTYASCDKEGYTGVLRGLLSTLTAPGDFDVQHVADLADIKDRWQEWLDHDAEKVRQKEEARRLGLPNRPSWSPEGDEDKHPNSGNGDGADDWEPEED